MFRRREESISPATQPAPTERVTSVMSNGINCKGTLSGSGGVRIEGTFEGEIRLRGLLVVGETGRVTCEHLQANVVIVAGAVRGDITAEKVDIRASGRVWGNVTTAAFSTEEGAFLRGQIRMEEKIELEEQLEEPAAESEAPATTEESAPAQSTPDDEPEDTEP